MISHKLSARVSRVCTQTVRRKTAREKERERKREAQDGKY